MVDEKKKLLEKIADLENEIKFLKETNKTLREQLKNYGWEKSIASEDSWKEIHEMGSL